MNPTTWHHPAARMAGRPAARGCSARRRRTRSPATWRSPRP